MGDTNRDDLKVALRETADATAYELGVLVDGAFLAFARYVPTQVDAAIADAKTQADADAAQAKADAQAQADADAELAAQQQQQQQAPQAPTEPAT